MQVWGMQILASPVDIVDRVKAEIQTKGIDLLEDIKPTHNNIMVSCIAHADGKERNPSLGISIDDVKGYSGEMVPAGTCHCFTCGYTADLPTFVSNVFGRNDQGMFGYRWIMRNFMAIEVENRPHLSINMNRDEQEGEEEQKYIEEEELQLYRYTHPYMYERKLTDKIINYFDVGYDANTGTLTFPVHNMEGKAVLIQRRSVQGKQFHNDVGADKGRYLYGLYQVYQNLDHIQKHIKEVQITESPIDALTFWTHKIPAVAIMQARPTEKQIELLRDLPIRKYVIATDNDHAGDEGAEKISEQLGDKKILYRVKFPSGVEDINEMTDEQIVNLKSHIFY